MVRTCRPVGVADPEMLLLGLAVAGLLAADLAEVNLFGLISWKRRVEEASAEQTRLAHELADLRLRLGQPPNLSISVQPQIDPSTLEAMVERALQRVTEEGDKA